MRYQILEDDSSEGLVRLVQEAIDAGWVPIGGVTAVTCNVEVERKNYFENRIVFAQALRKD